MKPISTVTAEALANAFKAAIGAKEDYSTSIEQDSRTFKVENRLVEGRKCTMFSMSDEYLFPPGDSIHLNWVKDVYAVSRNPRDRHGQSVVGLVVETFNLQLTFEVKDIRDEPKVKVQSGYPPRVPAYID